MAEGLSLNERWHLWILVPAFAWGGILAGFLLSFLPLGSLGCVLGSVAIAALAFTRKRKDIVSLCTPIFAVIIFVAPLVATLGTPPGLLMQVLYAATLSALVIRLEKRFQ
jgi:hypothetical protein